MKLVEKVPKDLYKIFGSKYMEFYMQFLVALYEESSQSYSLLGLTERECQMIMNERLAKMALDWSEARVDEEGELITRANMASVSLKHFEDWGWLRRDYDETLNSYVVSFPEYSQLFVELFQKLYSENDGKERESVLTVYSHLYTYSLDKEKNNEILKSALHTSRALLQMLANMQEGMRGYFDELSKQRSFRGIQEVLVKEINNSDSKKYAILTTTDSFYRYKEAVKELIEENLEKTEARKYSFETELLSEEENTRKSYRLRRMIEICEEATDMLYKISREFDAIERRYNKLIEQKTVFASRAAARIRYIMMEGVMEEDQTVALINLINESGKSEEILDKLSSKLRFSEPYKIMTEKSLYQRRENQKEKFTPQAVTPEKSQEENMTEFVLGSYRLEVDVEATRAWYGRYGNATGGCGCAYCRNYAAAVGVLPPEAAAFLEPLGLNLRRPGDIGEYGPRQGGRWYMPMWHIAGRLLEAGEGELPVAPGVTAGFATDMGPFLRNFPEPCFQCWLSMTLPWVLEEPADEAADDRDDEVKTLDRRTEP